MLTRIAPTPSGFLHLGNVLSFTVTAALAEKTGADILLRIDDMDRNRVTPAYVQDIFDTLNFLEIPWHRGPRNIQEFEREWSQLHRIELYKNALQALKDKNQVFACNCSRAQIRVLSADDTYPGTCCNKAMPLEASDTTWRLHTEASNLLNVHTWPDRITQTALPPVMQNFVVKKKDGHPAYQLSSLIDDLHFGVNLVVRGKDLWHSTLAQHYLAAVLNYEAFQQVQFYHHGLLTEAGGVKLSKSVGATSVKQLRQLGKTPADVYTATAEMMGINKRVESWKELAGLIL